MRLKTLVSLVVLTLVMLSSVAAAPLQDNSDPISGDWSATFFVEGTTAPATFQFKLEGNKVTGTAASDHTGPGVVTHGSWTDNKLSFTLEFKNHESIAVTGHFQDGKLQGEFRTEGFVAKWEARKK